MSLHRFRLVLLNKDPNLSKVFYEPGFSRGGIAEGVRRRSRAEYRRKLTGEASRHVKN